MARGIYKDVVVIGNGPSAITLSYLMAGNWPYYTGSSHIVDFLHCRLHENRHKSLVEQDVETLSEGLEGRSNNPVSLLFDVLNHPNADLGEENPSVLKWVHDPGVELDHVVLGRGLPGGCWQDMEGDVLTISLGSWMELPELSFREWTLHRNRERAVSSGLRQCRATVGSVAKYYQDYVDIKGLDKYFQNHVRVVSVRKLRSKEPRVWEVQGELTIRCQDTGETRTEMVRYITPNVVLATGSSDKPNRLRVDGEVLPFVLHTLTELEHLIIRNKNCGSGTLLIVGAGLSAADAIIAAHFHGIPTVHVFRRDVDDPDLIFNRLPPNMYPEYHKVHQMMRDSNQYEGYKSYSKYQVGEICPDRRVILVPVDGEGPTMVIKVKHVLVLVGKQPDLTFLRDDGLNLGRFSGKQVDSRNNTVSIDSYSHESVNEPGLYALGPLVGDNFVRFVQGGALAITSHLHRNRQKADVANVVGE